MTLAQLELKPAEWKTMMDTFVKKAHVFCEYAIDETNEAKAIEATAQPFVQPPLKKLRTEQSPSFFDNIFCDPHSYHIQFLVTAVQ